MRHRLVLSLFLFAAAGASAQPAPGTRADGIAAVVGESVILYSEVDALAQQAAQQRQVAVTPDLWSRALDQLVDRRVIVAVALRDTTIIVSEEQITAEVNRQVAQLAEQVGSEEALAAAYGRPIDDLRQSFREDTRDELLLQQARSRQFRNVSVTPGEVREWFDAIPPEQRTEVPELVRVAHVAVVPRASEAARGAARALAQAMRDSVDAGTATIESLADRYTQDPGNVNRTTGARNGGRYDGFSLSDLEPTFRAAVGALPPGGLSQVVETPFGFHVIRLNSVAGDRVSFNHILLTVGTGGSQTETALAELAVLRDSVVTHNVPFEAIARRHSTDAYSAQRGGFVADPQTGERDLRVEALGALDPRWRATVDTLTVGEVSFPSPVRLLDGSDGAHFVLLQKRTPAHPLGLESDYALLSQYTLNDKRQRLLSEWIERLRPTVFVDVRAPQYAPPTASTPAG